MKITTWLAYCLLALALISLFAGCSAESTTEEPSATVAGAPEPTTQVSSDAAAETSEPTTGEPSANTAEAPEPTNEEPTTPSAAPLTRSGNSTSDRHALVAFYNATDGPNWLDTAN